MPLITVKALEALKPKDRPYHVKLNSDLDGAWLRISVSGRKTWLLSYTPHGGAVSGRTLTLGYYPAMRPKEAQDAVRIAIGQIAAGGDPQAEKVAKKLKAKEDVEKAKEAERKAKEEVTDTVASVCDRYINLHGKIVCREQSWKLKKSVLDRFVVPAWGPMPIKSIEKNMSSPSWTPSLPRTVPACPAVCSSRSAVSGAGPLGATLSRSCRFSASRCRSASLSPANAP